MLKHGLLVLILACLAGGCRSDRREDGDVVENPLKTGNGTLAFEHQVTVEAPGDQMQRILQLAQTTCAKVPDKGCTLLGSELSRSREIKASVKLRATPQGVRQVIAAVSSAGTVTEQSSAAEDLSSPIQDAARQLQMLTSYRAKLDALAAKPDIETAALIHLQRELSKTQQEIELLAGQHAMLQRRVHTELLTITLHEPYHVSFASSIRAAAKDFAADLARGVAGAITASAYLLPAAALLYLLVLVRALRRWWRRRAPAQAAS